jgi:hypothetical protein
MIYRNVDVQLMRVLIFDANGIALESYDAAALKRGKTRDFKLTKDANWLAIANSSRRGTSTFFENPPAGDSVVRRNVPFYRKLGNQVRGDSQQFGAENPKHDKPNVMVFVSHTPERKDLIATIAGLPVPGGDTQFMLGKKMQRQVCEAARKIDLFLRVDATAGTCRTSPPLTRSIALLRSDYSGCLCETARDLDTISLGDAYAGGRPHS